MNWNDKKPGRASFVCKLILKCRGLGFLLLPSKNNGTQLLMNFLMEFRFNWRLLQKTLVHVLIIPDPDGSDHSTKGLKTQCMTSRKFVILGRLSKKNLPKFKLLCSQELFMLLNVVHRVNHSSRKLGVALPMWRCLRQSMRLAILHVIFYPSEISAGILHVVLLMHCVFGFVHVIIQASALLALGRLCLCLFVGLVGNFWMGGSFRWKWEQHLMSFILWIVKSFAFVNFGGPMLLIHVFVTAKVSTWTKNFLVGSSWKVFRSWLIVTKCLLLNISRDLSKPNKSKNAGTKLIRALAPFVEKLIIAFIGSLSVSILKLSDNSIRMPLPLWKTLSVIGHGHHCPSDIQRRISSKLYLNHVLVNCLSRLNLKHHLMDVFISSLMAVLTRLICHLQGMLVLRPFKTCMGLILILVTSLFPSRLNIRSFGLFLWHFARGCNRCLGLNLRQCSRLQCLWIDTSLMNLVLFSLMLSMWLTRLQNGVNLIPWVSITRWGIRI